MVGKMKKLILFVIIVLGINTEVYSQCANLHFQASSCYSESEQSTVTPLSDGCEHWPAPAINNGPHIARYQNQLTVNPPTGANHVIAFNANNAQAFMDWARGHWSLQCSTPRGLTWQATNSGGEFYWSSDPTVIGATTFAIGNSALDRMNYAIIVDSSGCSPSSPRGRSEIIFNNTNELWVQLPQYRWSTTPNACVSPLVCLDFQSIALHELGHYVGLAHDGPNSAVMVQYYRGRNINFDMCDVDRFRRLYCIPSVGRPVDVFENIKGEKISLEIYPKPCDKYINIKFKMELQERTSIYLCDLLGNTISLFADEIFNEGDHNLRFPINDIPAGMYILNFEYGKYRISEKVIVLK